MDSNPEMGTRRKQFTYAEKIAKYGREAVLAKKRADYRKRADKHKAAVYAYRAANPEKWRAENRAYQAKRRAADPLYERKKGIKKYGITFEHFERMFEAQGRCCAICDEPLDGHRQCIDHDHVTGVVRGILCDHCNVGIAMLKDSTELLDRAKAYLDGQRERLSESAASRGCNSPNWREM